MVRGSSPDLAAFVPEPLSHLSPSNPQSSPASSLGAQLWGSKVASSARTSLVAGATAISAILVIREVPQADQVRGWADGRRCDETPAQEQWSHEVREGIRNGRYYQIDWTLMLMEGGFRWRPKNWRRRGDWGPGSRMEPQPSENVDCQ
jgi:hypothetical protein